MISTIILRMNLFTMTTIVAITLLLPAEVSSLASSFFRCSNYRMQLPAKAFLGVRPIASSSLPRSLTESKPLSLVGLSASNFIAGTQVLLQQGRTMSRKSKNICGTSTWRGRGKGHERVTDVGGVGPQGMVNKKDAENKVS